MISLREAAVLMNRVEMMLALAASNIVSLIGLAAAHAVIQLEVFAVEEPHLPNIHAAPYGAYAAHDGRFASWIGCLRRRG